MRQPSEVSSSLQVIRLGRYCKLARFVCWSDAPFSSSVIGSVR